jgi:hypothetical protein
MELIKSWEGVMEAKYSVLTLEDIEPLELDKPDTCPFCHQGIDPQFHMAYLFDCGLKSEYRVVFSCPRKECLEVFIGYYCEFNI